MSRPGTAVTLIGLAAAAMLPGCTESDNVVSEIGVVRLVVVDPGLKFQSLGTPATVQAAHWSMTSADLTLGGRVIDLLAGGACEYQDTVVILPAGAGRCINGIVVGSSEAGAPASLTLSLTMTVRRAEPLVLPAMGDHDMDGVLNDVDLCPLIADPGQEDDDMNQIGDACEALNPFSGESELDSDADEVVDVFDNCVYVANPNQEDASLPPDGIGDACVEQSADVELGGSTDIQLALAPGNLVLAAGQATFITVDVDSTAALVNCDWAAGSCSLDPAQVEACFSGAAVSPAAGC